MSKTWNEILVNILIEKDRPMQRKEIEEVLKEKGFVVSKTMMGAIIHLATVNNLTRIKYPGLTSFYCLKKWVSMNGKIKATYKFDPVTKEFKDLTDEPKDQPTGVSNT